MKWLVLWLTITSFSVPCVDEYGREYVSDGLVCHTTIRKNMCREFDTAEDATLFIEIGSDYGDLDMFTMKIGECP